MARAAGHFCAADPSAAVLPPLTDALLALSTSRSEEVTFAAAEAVAYCFGGVTISPDKVLRSSDTNTALTAALSEGSGADDSDGADSVMADAGPSPASAPSPAVSADTAGDRKSAQDAILRALLGKFAISTRPEERCAASVWLLFLLALTGRHPRLMGRLGELQDVFSHLLSDPGAVTQEMASRGLSLLWRRGDAEGRKALVSMLVGTLSGDRKETKRMVKVDDDTEVFAAGALGEAPAGGGLSTYKELCALATDMGQPDLVYRRARTGGSADIVVPCCVCVRVVLWRVIL